MLCDAKNNTKNTFVNHFSFGLYILTGCGRCCTLQSLQLDFSKVSCASEGVREGGRSRLGLSGQQIHSTVGQTPKSIL